MTDEQITALENGRIHDEAVRLFDKYGTTACVKAMYRAKSEGDFYHRVAGRIAWLEERLSRA